MIKKNARHGGTQDRLCNGDHSYLSDGGWGEEGRGGKKWEVVFEKEKKKALYKESLLPAFLVKKELRSEVVGKTSIGAPGKLLFLLR